MTDLNEQSRQALMEALDAGDKLVAQLLLLGGFECEADDIRQVLQAMRDEDLDSVRSAAA